MSLNYLCVIGIYFSKGYTLGIGTAKGYTLCISTTKGNILDIGTTKGNTLTMTIFCWNNVASHLYTENCC